MTSKSSAGTAVRFGRPPKALAGAVEERIFGAARKVFLERGFEGASIEEIAEAARSGKPTIYARFPGKEALFTAVVMQSVAANTARVETLTPTGATIEERLESVAVAVLQWILASNVVGLMRVAIAESHRFRIWQAASTRWRASGARKPWPGYWLRRHNPASSARYRRSPRSS
jgi:AcrR family transcriptional regulator